MDLKEALPLFKKIILLLRPASPQMAALKQLSSPWPS